MGRDVQRYGHGQGGDAYGQEAKSSVHALLNKPAAVGYRSVPAASNAPRWCMRGVRKARRPTGVERQH